MSEYTRIRMSKLVRIRMSKYASQNTSRITRDYACISVACTHIGPSAMVTFGQYGVRSNSCTSVLQARWLGRPQRARATASLAFRSLRTTASLRPKALQATATTPRFANATGPSNHMESLASTFARHTVSPDCCLAVRTNLWLGGLAR